MDYDALGAGYRRTRVPDPRIARQIQAALGEVSVAPVPIPHDCSDGFLGVRWRRPEAYLDPEVRAGVYGFSRVDPDETAELVERLRRDLRTGKWDRRFGHRRRLAELDLGCRLVIADTWRHRGRATEEAAGSNLGASTPSGSRAPKSGTIGR